MAPQALHDLIELKLQALRVYVQLMRPFDVDPTADEVYEIARDNQAEILHRLTELAALLAPRPEQEASGDVVEAAKAVVAEYGSDSTDDRYGIRLGVAISKMKLALAAAAPRLGAEQADEQCEAGCAACSGEVCMTHDGRCDCDVLQRHQFNGQTFVGRGSGMVRSEATPRP